VTESIQEFIPGAVCVQLKHCVRMLQLLAFDLQAHARVVYAVHVAVFACHHSLDESQLNTRVVLAQDLLIAHTWMDAYMNGATCRSGTQSKEIRKCD
jgi:hypothetical protein